ncbi:MAG: Holliday junction branch migration protein RuvA [Bacteroidota bacterium]|nr:Holliday junction branch migration protein RuvA [Bacteroidota bacterium]
MISHLKGALDRKSPTEIVVDVNGVGYAVNITLATFDKLPEIGKEIFVLTYLHVREETQQLFGFLTETEREMFRLLISVSGIGPKIAQGILSGASAETLREMIALGNISSLTSLPGIGRKTAERLVVELRDKITKLEPEMTSTGTKTQAGIRSEALLALTSLGYNRTVGEKAIRSALQELNEKEPTLEELLKQAIKAAGR